MPRTLVLILALLAAPLAACAAEPCRYTTDRTEVTFSRADVHYAAFDCAGEGRRRAGMQATTADGAEHRITCAGVIEGRRDALGKSLRCDTDNTLNGDSRP